MNSIIQRLIYFWNFPQHTECKHIFNLAFQLKELHLNYTECFSSICHKFKTSFFLSKVSEISDYSQRCNSVL